MWGKAALSTLSKAPTLVLEDDERSSIYSYSSEELNIERENTIGESPRMYNRSTQNTNTCLNEQPIAEGYIVSKIYKQNCIHKHLKSLHLSLQFSFIMYLS